MRLKRPPTLSSAAGLFGRVRSCRAVALEGEQIRSWGPGACRGRRGPPARLGFGDGSGGRLPILMCDGRKQVCGRGWVRNLPDGRVEAVFEGPPSDVEAMLEWCRTGPRHAVVTGVEVVTEPARGEAGFSVRG